MKKSVKIFKLFLVVACMFVVFGFKSESREVVKMEKDREVLQLEKKEMKNTIKTLRFPVLKENRTLHSKEIDGIIVDVVDTDYKKLNEKFIYLKKKEAKKEDDMIINKKELFNIIEYTIKNINTKLNIDIDLNRILIVDGYIVEKENKENKAIGFYDHEENEITITTKITQTHFYETLLHEIGHYIDDKYLNEKTYYEYAKLRGIGVYSANEEEKNIYKEMNQISDNLYFKDRWGYEQANFEWGKRVSEFFAEDFSTLFEVPYEVLGIKNPIIDLLNEHEVEDYIYKSFLIYRKISLHEHLQVYLLDEEHKDEMFKILRESISDWKSKYETAI